MIKGEKGGLRKIFTRQRVTSYDSSLRSIPRTEIEASAEGATRQSRARSADNRIRVTFVSSIDRSIDDDDDDDEIITVEFVCRLF